MTTVKLTVTLDEKIMKEIDTKRGFESRSSFVRRMIQEGMKKRK